MHQGEEGHRFYPHTLGHIKHQQDVYHLLDVTDILHQCNAKWEEKSITYTTGYIPKE